MTSERIRLMFYERMSSADVSDRCVVANWPSGKAIYFDLGVDGEVIDGFVRVWLTDG